MTNLHTQRAWPRCTKYVEGFLALREFACNNDDVPRKGWVPGCLPRAARRELEDEAERLAAFHAN